MSPAHPHMGPAQPVAIPEKLSPAQPVFSWAWRGLALPGRLKTDTARPSMASLHSTLNTVSLHGVVLEISGGMPETETHGRNSNII